MKKNNKAETLVEVVSAIAILVFVLIWTSKMMWNARLTLNSANDRAMAVSLAREWLEMARYIRDQNWINYSTDKRLCWNFLSDNQRWNTPDGNVTINIANDDSCQEWLETGSANYIMSWSYLPLTNLGNESWWNFFLSTKWVDIENEWAKKDWNRIYADLADMRLCQTQTGWLITSCESPWIWDDKIEMNFFRKIRVEYVDINWDPYVFSPNEEKWANHMKITSSVIWRWWNKTQSVDLVTILSDYYKRSENEIDS